MKSIPFTCVLALVFLLPVASACCADGAPVASASTSSPVQNKAMDGSAKLPASVDAYAAADVGDGQRCQVGAKSDEDGMNERPVVYLGKVGGGFAWHVQLHISKDLYQGRATHCVASAHALYVLVQMDTQSEQSQSQTLLRVVELNRKTGAVIASKDIEVPNVSAAYTAWVDEGDDHFKLDEDRLVIKGSYELLSDRDNPSGKQPSAFTVEIPASLHP